MKLKCSAGHKINTKKVSLSGSMHKKPGDKCGQLISYDIMSGSKYCQCRLKQITDLETALAVALQLGAEAEANQLSSWSRDDRLEIAFHYGAEKWSAISAEDQSMLLAEYRKGERLERAKTFAEQLVTEITLEWSPADWEGESKHRLLKQARQMLDEQPRLYGEMFEAKLAFERFMGWSII